MPSLLINLAFLHQKPTGLATYALNIIPYLQPLAPLLASPYPIEPFGHCPVPQGMSPDFGLEGHGRRLWWTQWHLPQVYRQHQAALLFTPIPEAPLFRGCRYVATVHDLIPLRFFRRTSRLSLYFRHVVPQVLRQAAHIVCNSTSTANEVMEFFDIPAHKLTPIPLAFNAQQFQFLNLPPKPYFLYIGRHDHHKNLDRLIEAFLPLADNHELWIGGDYDRRYTPHFVQKVRHLNLETKVKFLGYIPQSEMITILNQALAVVFPSLWEGFGLPVLESMACGTPVITSQVSALPEVAGGAALLVNPYEVQSITAAMIQITRSEGLRQELRAAGLARASTFSWEVTGKATAAVLQQFLP